jgi:hypothetical protein
MLLRKKIKYYVAQLGQLDRPPVKNAVGLAQLVQEAFEFEFLADKIPLADEQYRLPNSGYDLDKAVAEIVMLESLPKPLILFTSLPYGDREYPHEPDGFYFSEEYPDQLFLVSTYLWDALQPDTGLQPYVLMMLAALVLGQLTELQYHAETRACMFDYCENVNDVLRTFEGTGLCKACEQAVMRLLRAGAVSSSQIAAVARIFDRAKGVRRCFLAMPFSPAFHKIHDIVARSVSNVGWLVVRADEIARPRHITDAIFQAILSSDLVVADVTGSNPNVFYELGFAHAAGCDIIMLCQKSSRRLPIDIAQERAVFYDATDDGLKILEEELRKLAMQA